MNNRNAQQQGDLQQVREARQLFVRSPDRPDGRFIRRRNEDEQLAKERHALRTAAWRKQCDERGRPTADQIGRALVMAICTHEKFVHMFRWPGSLVDIALSDLEARGFRREEIVDVMQRIRWRHVDPADRAGEATESTVDNLTPTAWTKSSSM